MLYVLHCAYVIASELAKKLVDDNISTDHGVAAWLHLRQWMKENDYPMESLASKPRIESLLKRKIARGKFTLYL